MLYLVVKFALTALIVVAVSEIQKSSKLAGAILVSLPITTYLAMIWIYADAQLKRGEDAEAPATAVQSISGLSVEMIWLVLPSLVPFVLLPWLLRKDWGFPLSLTLATLAMVAAYWLTIWGGRALGLRG